MLAAIPSIIYGLWGFFVLAPFMRDHVEPWLQTYLGPIPVIGALFQGPMLGKDILTAGVILSIMILPTIMAISREIIATVPDHAARGDDRAGRHQVGDDHTRRCCPTRAPA